MSIRALQVELTAHHNQLLWFCSNGQPLEMSHLAQVRTGAPASPVLACWGGQALGNVCSNECEPRRWRHALTCCNITAPRKDTCPTATHKIISTWYSAPRTARRYLPATFCRACGRTRR